VKRPDREAQARLITGWIIQSFEAVTLTVLLGQLWGTSFHLEVPVWASTTYYSLFSLSIVVGAALCWRLPDRRRYLAWIVSGLLVVSVYQTVTDGFAQEIARAPQARLAEIRASSPYRSVVAAREAALRDLDGLIQRTALIPGDFTTQYRDNEAAKDRLRQSIGQLDQQIVALERQSNVAAPALPVAASNTWGADAVRLFSAILTAAVETLALALTNVGQGRRNTRPRLRLGPGKAIHPDHLLYLRTALRYGDGELVAGYRRVAAQAPMSQGQARRLMERCLELGYIRDRRLCVRVPEE
jgi:hypothetical protein